MISFFEINTQVLSAPDLFIKTAYLFICTSSTSEYIPLVYSAIQLAKQSGFDLFNIISNDKFAAFVDDLGFIEGDGSLDYYIYNWKTDFVPSNKNSITMF